MEPEHREHSDTPSTRQNAPLKERGEADRDSASSLLVSALPQSATANGTARDRALADEIGETLNETADTAMSELMAEPMMVYCLHCGKEYMSSELVYRAGASSTALKSGAVELPTNGNMGCDGSRSGERLNAGVKGRGEAVAKWCCPTPGCHAAGFGLDIFPVDPEWNDPSGVLRAAWEADDDADLDDDDFFDDEDLFDDDELRDEDEDDDF